MSAFLEQPFGPREYREFRRGLKLTQAELAEVLGVTRETVVAREKGKTVCTREMVLALRQIAHRKATGRMI